MFSRSLNAQYKKSFFLFGARGTGKSTWLATQYPAALVFDLLEASTYTRLLADPGALERLIPQGHAELVVIDEVQRIPALLDVVHRLIEKRKIRFALTGSSARKLRRGGVNLLAGRALTYRMHPLTAVELGTAFDLDKSLLYGHLPMTFSAPEPAKYLDSYVQTYLREEVLQEGLTRNIGAFARFLEAASFSHGGVLSVAAVARDAAIERKTVEGYFGILEDLLLAVRLTPFTKRAKRKVVMHPKFYVFDAGVFRALRPKGPLDRPEEIAGAALEGLVMQELRAANDYGELGYSLHFWRTRDLEVDFVLYGAGGIHAFEVKHTSRVRDADLKGLRAFLDAYPGAKAYLLYMGATAEQAHGIDVLPVKDALRRLPSLL